MATWREEEEYAARHRQEKREGTRLDYVVICVAVEETINTHIMYSLQPSFIVVQCCILVFCKAN